MGYQLVMARILRGELLHVGGVGHHAGMGVRMKPEVSRRYWRALMANVVGLICDAQILLEHESAGRARALLILAREELARANAVYSTAHLSWTEGRGVCEFPKHHLSFSTKHPDKIAATDSYSRELGPFWGEYDDVPPLSSRAEVDQLNSDKQAGFYVDSAAGKGGQFGSPLDVEPGPVVSELQFVARLAEMALISDHTRMRDCDQPYDSTYDLQSELTPIAHPEEFADFIRTVSGGADEP
ncbi:AbiV family abortive infection protein [Nocardia neocaledoniensis]|uniref:AbiV family abortive infection protein n=1 Tax=Nocardia neocaledoniensis TaxID=236511 RepID=UPI0024583949|nr:AbiV family abortive infection protein [Nocardia neocaledoniensis]